MTGMTKAERAELGQLIRKREKVLKHHAAERSAELLAQFDAQSAKVYHWDEDATWAAAKEAALKAVESAREMIAARCRELGIPPEFSPDLHASWSGRGQNGMADRRAELRRAAKSRIEAIEKAAITQIERMSLEAQTTILAQGLESEAAKTFLNSMPSMASLMPPVEVDEIRTLIEARHAEQKQRYLQ